MEGVAKMAGDSHRQESPKPSTSTAGDRRYAAPAQKPRKGVRKYNGRLRRSEQAVPMGQNPLSVRAARKRDEKRVSQVERPEEIADDHGTSERAFVRSSRPLGLLSLTVQMDGQLEYEVAAEDDNRAMVNAYRLQFALRKLHQASNEYKKTTGK